MQATTLDEYFTCYAPQLGQQAREALAPLHVPGRDPLPALDLKRTPFEAQMHVIVASAKAIKRQKSVLIIAEMGTGKSLMGMTTVHLHAAGKPYRALIFCPGQLVRKAHEEKSATSAQGNALGSLAAACKKVIALTGTLIGGYAEHVRPLLFRLSPSSLVQEGLGWTQVQAFSERYGRIETKITEREGDNGRDNSQSRGSTKTTKQKYIRPGIMPTLFGRHLIGNALFLSLAEVAANLPPLIEEIIPVKMDSEQANEYAVIEKALADTVRRMIRTGSKALLGAMLQTLLAYPDYPYGWDQVGYWERSPGGQKFYVPVVWPRNLDPVKVRPKEEQLLDIIDRERLHARQVWVFVQYTQKHDVAQRLYNLCRKRRYRTGILRSDVPLADREEWIAKNGRGLDVVISHPKLVETGLDLFDKRPGRHNFCTLVFYETGYNLFTMRQAARRGWRIGQKKDCKVLYMYYEGTLQERAMALMGKKLSAAQALEGSFSTEGLAAMGGEDGSAEIALAKSLADQIDDDSNASRHWERVGAEVKEELEAEEETELASLLQMDFESLSLPF